MVGHYGYLGPLVCNFFLFFIRKNNFEGTFLTDELAQWKFLMCGKPVYENLLTVFLFSFWLVAFIYTIVVSYCVAFCDYFKLRTLIRTNPAANQQLFEQNKVINTAPLMCLYIFAFYWGIWLWLAIQQLNNSYFGLIITRRKIFGDSVFTVFVSCLWSL